MLGLQFSQLSLRSSKLIFKIKYMDDTKRIPQENSVSFADVIRRCEKSFSLESGRTYALYSEERGQLIHSQEQLTNHLQASLGQSQGHLKLTLRVLSSEIDVLLSSRSGSVQNGSSSAAPEPQHVVHPGFLLKVL